MQRELTTITGPQRAEVETLAAVLTAQQLADYFGVGRTTFFTMMNRDPDLAERYKRGRARAVGSVAQSLLAKARSGNVTAMIFFLKTQGGWRETLAIDARTEMVEPGTITAEATSGVARLLAHLDAIALRQAVGTGPSGSPAGGECAMIRGRWTQIRELLPGMIILLLVFNLLLTVLLDIAPWLVAGLAMGPGG